MNEIRSFDGKQHPIGLDVQPLPGAGFGGRVRFDDGVDTEVQIAALEAHPERLPGVLYDRNGLLVLSGVDAITKDPELLLRLSRLFGPEVENYLQTLSTPNLIHESVDQILVLSNLPPHNREPPPQPDPPRAEDGSLPVQFPHRRGWHTDQSFRRPPPDISLFYAVTPSPKGQGQTLYANGRLAYEALPAHLEERVEDLVGVLSGYPTFHDNVGYETGTQLSWISFSTRHHLACRVALSSIHTCAHSLETSWKRSPKLEHVRNTNGSLREEMLSSCPLTAIG